ncbi:MAG: hypothetical protein KatS3mg043_1106 [Rhodothermaceae bacterium]|nr:MAG: hypothetical protein KatS3mg043_1106 [Rhodothermaceae bacterium]
MKRRYLILFLGCMMMCGTGQQVLGQQTRHVALGGDDAGNACLDAAAPCASVGRALAVAEAGDVIEVGAGTFYEGDLTIRTDVTLRGAGADVTVLDADASDGPSETRIERIPPAVALLRAGVRVAYKHAGSPHAHVLRVEAGVTARVEDMTLQDGGDLFTDNRQGGGVWNAGTLTLARVIVRDNVASVASDYEAEPRGGGIWNGGTLHLVESLVERNAAAGFLIEGGRGGGIWNEGMLVLERSTVAANTASDVQDACYGAGLYNAGTLIVRNSTLSGNALACFEGGAGGGLFNAGEALVEATTLAGNTVRAAWDGPAARSGGLAATRSASTRVRGSLVAGNTAVDNDATADCDGLAASDGFNVFAEGTGCPAGATDTLVDPASVFTAVLGPLADHGGPTPVHALLAGSPALDAGTCLLASGDTLAVDQRGYTRWDGACDAGAFEEGADATEKVAVATEDEPADVPSAIRLEGNYPNPFNPSTQIVFTLAEARPVRLAVYDVLGRQVALLVDGLQPAGRRTVTFAAGGLPGGLYVYRLEAGREVQTRTMMLVR